MREKLSFHILVEEDKFRMINETKMLHISYDCNEVIIMDLQKKLIGKPTPNKLLIFRNSNLLSFIRDEKKKPNETLFPICRNLTVVIFIAICCGLTKAITKHVRLIKIIPATQTHYITIIRWFQYITERWMKIMSNGVCVCVYTNHGITTSTTQQYKRILSFNKNFGTWT